MRSAAVEDYNLVDTSVHHESVLKGTVPVQAYAKVSDRMKSEAVLAALKGRTWDAATQEEVEYVEPQIELSGDDPNLEAIQKSHQAYLECSSKGASAGPPKQLLSRTGNPVGSTTSSNTLFRFGKTLGAVEKFKSRDDLQHLAHDCLVRLAVLQLGQSTRQLQEINQLKQRFHAITGQAADTANYATPSAVVLSEEVQKVAGTVRLYSGRIQTWVLNRMIHPLSQCVASAHVTYSCCQRYRHITACLKSREACVEEVML